jgi:isochorismate synthase
LKRKIDLADTLIYRIPNEKTIALDGSFKEVDSYENIEGFIITSFNKEQKYFFEIGTEEGRLYLDEIDVVCQSHPEYIESASSFLNGIRSKNMDKAVFSRIKKMPFRKNAKQLFYQLCEQYPEAFVYLVSSPLFGTWIGATPELLLNTTDGEAETLALAGTLRTLDEGRWGQKEIDEQVYVCDFIKERLASMGIEDVKESGRTEVHAGPVRHLSSTFKFPLNNIRIESLIDALHPTPAVSGRPQEKAIELISKTEKHNRSLYAGVIGCVQFNDARLYVNLRCARLTEDSACLYLGGGFTVDSDVEKEWEETENKARTLLDVLENL